MKKNNNIIKLLTVAFIVITSVSQVNGMEKKEQHVDGRHRSYGTMDSTKALGSGIESTESTEITDKPEKGYFAAKHAQATRNELAGKFCNDLFGTGTTPWVGSRSVEEIIYDLSGRLAGGESQPLLEISKERETCSNAAILNMVHRLNTIDSPNTPEALWTVCRGIQLLLYNKMILTCPWLGRVKADRDNKVDYLIGDHGVVTSAISALSSEKPNLSSLAGRGRGTTGIFELSAMFLAASQAFPKHLWENIMQQEQRIPYFGRAFTGYRGDVSMADVFDSAFLNADFSAHVPEVTVRLVSELREVSGIASINGEKLQRAKKQRDNARGKLSTLRRFLDGLSCFFRCFCCIPSSRDLLGDD